MKKAVKSILKRSSSPKVSKRATQLEETIWSTYTPLAVANNAVNLGQGFPDWKVDDFVLQAFANQAGQPVHQYAKAHGDPILVQALQRLYNDSSLSGFKYGSFSPEEILVTNGASDALYIVIQSLVNPGDEVIIIEPFYDAYKSAVELSGAKPVYIPLRPPEKYIDENVRSAQEWKLDIHELRSKITKKTKAIILNTPHNPTGKVFDVKELEQISQIVLSHKNLFVISDEVYEFLTFNRQFCNRISNIDGMFDRTLSISSVGKTFSVTGWKIGWILGPKSLIRSCYLVNQYIKFCISTPLQRATAECIHYAIDNDYFSVIRNRLLERRDMLSKMLVSSNVKPLMAEGGYFLLTDVSNVQFPYEPNNPDTRDVQFCKWLPQSDVKLAAIPPSAFYSNEHKHMVKDFARFCFCKKEETILAAEKSLEVLRKYTK
ncbi:hypothetical protein FDP41_001147 [Naegleria fowleri]|uniref:Aminotransferase class I/classII large domain-containing protein n=1 Tax=Naegleria fowleri TaxID=5763 RepID=A0A6A5C092_NAEFO|nr:uncharacterized protein FDP41_001147 [Naegleria fowleri]KAF0979994.1 hypothetical protein FDP41_001147 [Naegleria fowleri]CAG4714030.1 unnamed protein product [Naegleria fowleri]